MNPLAIPLPAVLPHPTDTRASPEFPLRLGGGKREAPPLPKGPSELGEANTGPRSLPPRVSRQKTQYQLQAGARGGRGGARREGGGARGARARPECPDAALRQSEAGASGRGWGEAEETQRGPHPSLHVARQRPSRRSARANGPRRESPQPPRPRRQRSQTKWRRRPPLSSSSRRFPPEVREPTLARHPRPAVGKETKSLAARRRGLPETRYRRLALPPRTV